MKNFYVIFCLMMMSGVALCAPAQLVSKKTVSAEGAFELKKVRNFNAEFVAWKKKLTKDQLGHLGDFFDSYDELYRSYKMHPDSVDTYEMMTSIIQAMKNMMENWDSFYNTYIDVQIFAQKVQNWQRGLTPEKKAKTKTALSIYTTLYNRYEQSPTNAKYASDLQREQGIIQKLMNN